MAENKKLRFIREEPWIARTFRTFRPVGIVPEDLHDWLWDWVEDVGAAMRSREMMVSFIVSMGYYAISIGLLSLLESLGLAPSITRLIKRKGSR
jgi:hypothetical protein